MTISTFLKDVSCVAGMSSFTQEQIERVYQDARALWKQEASFRRSGPYVAFAAVTDLVCEKRVESVDRFIGALMSVKFDGESPQLYFDSLDAHLTTILHIFLDDASP